MSSNLICIKKQSTGTGVSEVHILSAPVYDSFVLQRGSALPDADDSWEFAAASNADLFCFQKQGTESGHTEVHVLTAESDYQSFSTRTATPLEQSDKSYQLLVLPNRDVLCVKKQGANNTTEVHVLDANSNYAEYKLHAVTALAGTDDDWTFGCAGNGDLFAIMKRDGDNTAVHVLNAASNYQDYAVQTKTALQATDANWAFVVLPNRDVLAVNRQGAEGTEVSVLSADSQYSAFSLQATTVPAIGQTDSSTFGFAAAVAPPS